MIEKQKIKVVIVDDYPGVRAGIRNLLQAAKDIVVVGEGANGREAIELALTKNPDIVLLDVELPDLRGDVVTLRIHEIQPGIKILAVSSYSDRQFIHGMLETGAAGYITKDEAPAMLLDAIRSIIYSGRNWLSPRAVKNTSLVPIEEQMLTKREIHILEQLVLERTEAEIAVFLGTEEGQVKRYVRLLMKKFEADSLASLRLIARRMLARLDMKKH
ncbi:MAG TPA: response regulator transcription factor [Anaerolineales bacterium]|nr:response regulator transcription factor [Anaerolineales bacterium]